MPERLRSYRSSDLHDRRWLEFRRLQFIPLLIALSLWGRSRCSALSVRGLVRISVLGGALFGLDGCTSRGLLEFAEGANSAAVRSIFVAKFRQEGATEQGLEARRPTSLSFERIDVSIPPSHAPGRIEWPRGEPNALTDFVTVGRHTYADLDSFTSAVAAADLSGQNETVLHVHGYNVTHAEAVYGAAQVAHDLDIPVPLVLFSWPSAARTTGYFYDRESALISRDMLHELIVAFGSDGQRDLFLTGHSMGGYLLMEALRQIAISKDFSLSRRINGVMLMSPDIDTEVFRSQAKRIGKLPEPFLIMVADNDIALKLSGRLTGRPDRLGSLTDLGAVDDLSLTLIEVSELSNGAGLNHSIPATSPAALAIVKVLNEMAPPGNLHVIDRTLKLQTALLRELPGP